MSGRVEHKSRSTGRSSERHGRKKKSKKRSSSSSDHAVTVAGQRNAGGRDKKQKSRKKKRRRSYSSDSSSSELSWLKLKLETKSKQLLGERPEFSRNASRIYDTGVPRDNRSHPLLGSQSREQKNGAVPRNSHLGMMERRVLSSPNAKARKESSRKRSHSSQAAKKSGKSRKRRRSLSRSSSSSDSSSSESSSSSGSSSDSSSSSVASSEERRRKKRREKKRLAKKVMRREEKKRKEERRKLKKMIKVKSGVPVVQEIKRQMIKAPEDRLLKAINVELADRARAMAPMTREEWEKKQSIVRRVYDEVTGRQRSMFTNYFCNIKSLLLE